MPRNPCLSIATLVLTLVTSAPCFAQRFDPPVLAFVSSSHSSIQLMVRAGGSGAPLGFSVQWMTKAEYDRIGGWPDNPLLAEMYHCDFTGVPTHNVFGLDSYQLQSYQEATIEVGDLFDETGVTTDNAAELSPGVDYVFRAYVLGAGATGPSDYSTSEVLSTMSPATNNCTYTQGFWKTHPEAWPVNSLTLGTVTYTKNQLLSILNQPADGNGLLILAHQLIAAKLNIAKGADPSPVASTIAASDAQIGDLVCPPVGDGYLPPSSVSDNEQALDSYNNGQTSVPHCDDMGPTPAGRASWGSLKIRHR